MFKYFLLQGKSASGNFVKKVFFTPDQNNLVREKSITSYGGFEVRYGLPPLWINELKYKSDLTVYNVSAKDIAKAILVMDPNNKYEYATV